MHVSEILVTIESTCIMPWDLPLLTDSFWEQDPDIEELFGLDGRCLCKWGAFIW